MKIEKSKITDADLEKINKFTRRELTADEVYTFSVVLCDNDVDRDYEKFTVDALKALQPMFVGKTGIIDHSPSANNQNSRIFETWIETHDEKKTVDGEALTQLKAKAYVLKNEKSQTLIDEIEAGIKKEVSVSLSTEKSVCSICGEAICKHQRGKTYDGKLCYFTLENPTDAYEFSFVAVPAQRGAGVTKCFDLEKGRECRAVKMLFDNVGVCESRTYEKDGIRVIETFDTGVLEKAKTNDIVMKDGEVIARSKDGSLRVKQDGTSIYFAADGKINGEVYMSFTAKSTMEFQRMDGGCAVYRRNINEIEKIYSISNGAGVAEKSINNLFDGVIEKAQAERLAALKNKKLALKKQIAKMLMEGKNDTSGN